MFFRAFEIFGIYFVIMIVVTKRITSFLVVLLLILEFCPCFFDPFETKKPYSLERPTNNDDSNNPWNPMMMSKMETTPFYH